MEFLSKAVMYCGGSLNNPAAIMYDNNPQTLLNLHRLPARVDYKGAAVLLNFEVLAIKALVEMGLLKTLGNAHGNEHRYFSTRMLLRLGEDEKWLNEATRALKKYWAQQNGKRRPRRERNIIPLPQQSASEDSIA